MQKRNHQHLLQDNLKLQARIGDLEYQVFKEQARARALEEQMARRDTQLGTVIELLAESLRASSLSKQSDDGKEPGWAAPARELAVVFCETIKESSRQSSSPRQTSQAPQLSLPVSWPK